MFKNLFVKIVSWLQRPLATLFFVFIITFISIFVQPQPWSFTVRIILALLPALLVALISIVLFRYVLQWNQIWVALFSIFLWILILIDVGTSFIGWILIFSVVVLAFVLLNSRYSLMLSAGMVVFGIFYGGFQLHQGEQYLYLRYLIQGQNQERPNQLTAHFTENKITLSDSNGKFKEIEIPSSLHFVRDMLEANSFMGLSPLFVLSASANNDVTALPMVAVLDVVDDFPIELWNIRISSSLNDLQKEGRISEPKQIERELKCGSDNCIETLWQYEDRFQATEIQIGYRFHSSETELDRPHRLLIWFREPVVVGFPHHPVVLEFLKAVSL